VAEVRDGKAVSFPLQKGEPMVLTVTADTASRGKAP
jgi:hypothetical protein